MILYTLFFMINSINMPHAIILPPNSVGIVKRMVLLIEFFAHEKE